MSVSANISMTGVASADYMTLTELREFVDAAIQAGFDGTDVPVVETRDEVDGSYIVRALIDKTETLR